MQERELLVELKVLEQRVLAEERGSHYSGASLAAEDDRQPLLQQRCGSGRHPCMTPAGDCWAVRRCKHACLEV